MADEDALIKATKNKGRSASVCFSSSARHHDRSNVDGVGASPPATPPPYGVAGASGAPPAAKSGRRTACRSQSARLTGGKSVRRRLPPTERDAEPVPDSPHSIKSVVSDPRLYDYEGNGHSEQ
ncbi:hypothetical protein V9T40_001706 [Parthenolecanium corni]|uniref:Uncharacterized protein n=1 Tax=Parthenolecanium corni TaxID=536013 RepID=A0AAN9TJG8_9HEMI